MDDERYHGFESHASGEEDNNNRESSARARNRTVMLTPEVTGEVRARLAQELQSGSPIASAPGFGSVSGGGDSVQGRAAQVGSTYSPAGSIEHRAPPAPQQGVKAIAAKSQSGDEVVWIKDTPVKGFLVSFDRNQNGDVFELRSGRLIVTSEAAGAGNYLVLRDETVSPMHAILRVGNDGEIQVLDQLSEHGTGIERLRSAEQEHLSGDKSFVEHGDIISFGERSFQVCLLAR